MHAKMNDDELLASLQRCVNSLSVGVIVQDMVLKLFDNCFKGCA